MLRRAGQRSSGEYAVALWQGELQIQELVYCDDDQDLILQCLHSHLNLNAKILMLHRNG